VEEVVTVQELAAKTADLIEEYGWHYGSMRSNAGCLCVVGAASLAATGNAGACETGDEWTIPEGEADLRALLKILARKHEWSFAEPEIEEVDDGTLISYVTEWNDEQAKAQGVIAALKEIASS
jgi:hypothetical protein